jgi:hypothetical protein
VRKKEVIQRLKEAERNLEALCDAKNDSGCCLPEDVKKAVRGYILTWCLHPVQKALDELERK